MVCERLERRTGTDRRRDPLTVSQDRLGNESVEFRRRVTDGTGTESGVEAVQLRSTALSAVYRSDIQGAKGPNYTRAIRPRRRGEIKLDRSNANSVCRGIEDCGGQSNTVLKSLFCQARSRIIYHLEKTVLTLL